jgi:mycothiol system anti-sigma-R factor
MRQGDCFFDDAELNLYLDSELGSERKASLNTHVVKCPVCARRFEVPRNLKIRIKDICGKTRAPETLRESTIKALENSRATIFSGFWDGIRNVFNGRPLIPVSLAAALVIIFCGALFLKSESSRGESLVSSMIHEHNEYLENIDAVNKIVSSDGPEIERWIVANSGITLKLTSDKGFSPCAACTITEDGRKITCLFFGGGPNRISCFMVPGNISEIGTPGAHKIRDINLCCGKDTGDNYIAWSSGQTVFILVSQLPEATLLSLAENLI